MYFPPPPPIISSQAPLNVTITQVVSFAPGEILCNGRPVASAKLARPFAAITVRYGTAQRAAAPATYRFSFAIDETGRPHMIRKIVEPAAPGFYVDTSDLAPALAASRFASGATQQGCSISYVATATPIAAAPLAFLYEAVSRPSPNPPPREVFDRIRPQDAKCERGPGAYRQLNYPTFESIPMPAGTWAWTFLAYDVDLGGRVRNARVLGSSGDVALNRASLKALSSNRYAPGPGSRGCTYHFYRVGSVDPLPVELPPGVPGDTGELPACAIDPKQLAALFGRNSYPAAFARRRIEGVAAISYDTAPWGAIGNIKVIASEPDEAFGEAARNAASSAKVQESAVGHRGCVRRIRYKLPPEAQVPNR